MRITYEKGKKIMVSGWLNDFESIVMIEGEKGSHSPHLEARYCSRY